MTRALTADRLRELLTYDPETGQFERRRQGGKKKVGSDHCNGYVQIHLDGSDYLAHRLAWLYVTGRWPVDEIDHINRRRNDNRFANLREADRPLNCQNMGIRSDNKTGIAGVSWCAERGKWAAEVHVDRRRYRLGRFETIEAAAEACAAKRAQVGRPMEVRP